MSSPVTAIRMAILASAWVAVVVLAGPSLGLSYATFATWAVVPPLGLVYAYCASHRSRAAARLAAVATVAAVLVIGLAIVTPEATAT
jgi:hypothetical protein